MEKWKEEMILAGLLIWSSISESWEPAVIFRLLVNCYCLLKPLSFCYLKLESHEPHLYERPHSGNTTFKVCDYRLEFLGVLAHRQLGHI